jgi:15,16-dihydrobiliverdin:ferredoxin oxidoreductase
MFQVFKEFLETELFGRFELQPRTIPMGLGYETSDRGKTQATIQSWCYQCPQLRKVRYTYIDAGPMAQVFNSVIYPDPRYDIPLLGIDFLCFGNSKKILVVLDFQPLFRDNDYLSKYIAPMQPIRDKYNELAQDLEMKFYDANQYFSRNLLFAKTDADTVLTRLFPAYQEYLQLYWQTVQQAKPSENPEDIQRIIKAQKDYDQYSADRDPAHGLFSSYFGAEWASKFLYEFLFEDALPLAVSSGH